MTTSLISAALLGGMLWGGVPTPQEGDTYGGLERERRAAGAEAKPTGPEARATPQESKPSPVAKEKPAVAPPSITWGKVKASGAIVRTLFDQRSPALRTLPAGTFVRIHRKSGNWLLVEVPGGLCGWIISKYLQETGRSGEFEVTAARVNFRPQAGMSSGSALEPDRFERGYRVLALGTEGEWTKVLAPPEMRGWIRADTVERGVSEGEAKPAYDRQQLAYVEARVEELRAALREQRKQAELDRVRVALDEVDGQLERELARGLEADLDGITKRYRDVGSAHPGEEVAALVDQRLEKLKLHRALLAAQEAQRELAAREAKSLEEARAQAARKSEELRETLRVRSSTNPRRARYEYFGWLRQSGPGIFKEGLIEYELERGGEVHYRLRCSSGRYEIREYLGREIAVAGDVVPHTAPPLIEIRKIRILSNARR